MSRVLNLGRRRRELQTRLGVPARLVLEEHSDDVHRRFHLPRPRWWFRLRGLLRRLGATQSDRLRRGPPERDEWTVRDLAPVRPGPFQARFHHNECQPAHRPRLRRGRVPSLRVHRITHGLSSLRTCLHHNHGVLPSERVLAADAFCLQRFFATGDSSPDLDESDDVEGQWPGLHFVVHGSGASPLRRLFGDSGLEPLVPLRNYDSYLAERGNPDEYLHRRAIRRQSQERSTQVRPA